MRGVQLVGFLLWRGGIAFLIAYSFYHTARRILRFVDIPPQLQVGGGLIITGLALVVLSLILERIHDVRAERQVAD